MEIRKRIDEEPFKIFASGLSNNGYDNIGGIFYGSDDEYNALIAEFLFNIRNTIDDTLRAIKKGDKKSILSKNKALYEIYKDFEDFIKKNKVDVNRYKGEFKGIKLRILDTISFKHGELPRFRFTNSNEDKIIHIHSGKLKKNVSHVSKEDLDTLIFIKLGNVIGKLDYGKAVRNLSDLPEGKYPLAKIITRTYIVEKLLETIEETIKSIKQVDQNIQEYVQSLYRFLSKCLEELNKRSPEGGLKDAADFIDFIQDKIFPLYVNFDQNSNIIYISKFGLSEKKTYLRRNIEQD